MQTELVREAIDHVTTRLAQRRNSHQIHWTERDIWAIEWLIRCCEQFLTELEMGFIDLSKST